MLSVRAEKMLAAVLAGKTHQEAAEISGLSRGYIDHALREDSRYPEIYAEYRRRLMEQSERLTEKADRSKEALIAELEEIAIVCKDGKPIVDKEGEIVGHERDTTNWIKTVVERAKLLGYYVEKKEISGKLTVADIIGSIDLDDDEDE